MKGESTGVEKSADERNEYVLVSWEIEFRNHTRS